MKKKKEKEKGVLTINGSNDNKLLNAPPAMNEERNLMMRSFTIPTTFYSNMPTYYLFLPNPPLLFFSFLLRLTPLHIFQKM